MLTTLFDIYEKNHIASIFLNSLDAEIHLTGFVGAVSADSIIVKHVSPEGLYDGFVLLHIDDICRLDVNGKYEQKIRTLYEIKEQSHPTFSTTEDLYSSLLLYCQKNNICISAELDNSKLIGVISDFDNNHIRMQLMTEYGEKNGETIVLSNHISSFSADSQPEHDIKILFDRRYK